MPLTAIGTEGSVTQLGIRITSSKLLRWDGACTITCVCIFNTNENRSKAVSCFVWWFEHVNVLGTENQLLALRFNDHNFKGWMDGSVSSS